MRYLDNILVQQALGVGLQLVAFIVLSLVAACVPWIYQHVKNRTLAAAFAAIAQAAALAVFSGAGAVRDLKDPTKPGQWGPEAAARFRAAAVGIVMQLARDALTIVRRGQGLTAAGVEQVVELAVEAAVEQNRRGLGLSVPVPSVLRGPTAPARVPQLPPTQAPAGSRAGLRAGERGRASLGALLGLLGLVAFGCGGGAAATLTAAADTASSVVLVARKVRAALCAEQLDPYLGPVRERVVVVHDVALDAGSADGAVDAGAGAGE